MGRILLDPANNTSVTVGATSTQLLAANETRAYALITNDSDEVMYLAFGEDAVMNSAVRINPRGGSCNIGEGGDNYFGAVNAICASGGKVALIVEFSHIH
mgnify:CR=1 FL=1|jgi:hypothetical protein